MKPPDLATLESLPGDALMPVRWIRELVDGLEMDETAGIGLTVQEVADATDRAPSTVRTWCAEGRLPGAKRLRGREWRIPRSALKRLLEVDAPERVETTERLKVPKGGLSAWRRES